MIWQPILEAITGIGKVAVDMIDQFHLDPEEKLKLKQALFEAQVKARHDVWALEDSDRADARKRETNTQDSTTKVLAYCYTCGYFLTLFAAWKYGIPADAHDVFATLLGVLSAAQMAIIGYYYGTSHSSSKKDETLDRVVNHKESAK